MKKLRIGGKKGGLSSLGRRVGLKIKPKLGFAEPDMDSLFEPDPDFENPLDDVEGNATLEEDATEELGIVGQAIMDGRKKLQDRFRIANDVNFYCIVVFQCEDQKKEFLRQAGWQGRKQTFFNGLKIAELLGVDIERVDLPMRSSKRQMPKFCKESEVIS